MTCKSKKESVVLRVMLGSTLHNWTQKSEIPQVSTLMCTPGLFGLCRGCRVGLAACKQGCWLRQPLENPIIVRSFRATRRCIYYKMGGNYFWRDILIFMPLCFHKKIQAVLTNLDKINLMIYSAFFFPKVLEGILVHSQYEWFLTKYSCSVIICDMEIRMLHQYWFQHIAHHLPARQMIFPSLLFLKIFPFPIIEYWCHLHFDWFTGWWEICNSAKKTC